LSFFDGAPFNPLALPSDNPKAIETSIIELRDIVEVAARAFTNMGHRQLAKLQDALRVAYHIGRQEHRWPTLKTLDDVLEKDLRKRQRGRSLRKMYLPDGFKIGAEVRMGPLLNFGFEISRIL
jgi:hypothetical protein